MHRLMKNHVLFLLITLCCTAGFNAFSQEASNIDHDKTVLWSKIENGYQVQLIRENDHEYILKTPVEIFEEPEENKYSVSNTGNGLFDNSHITGPYRIPEIQTADLVRSRMYQMDAGLPVIYNDAVKREVDRLLVSRQAIEMALGRAHYFLPTFTTVTNELQLPRALRYLPLVESSFRPHGYSRVGARGIWQFMSATARFYGLTVNGRVDQRLDPEKSTKAAMILLRDLYDEFGDWNLALAAYNAGPGRVSRAIRMAGVSNPTFWDVDQFLPRETRRYIPKFLAAVYVMEHVDQIGLMPDVRGYKDVKEQIESLQYSNFAAARTSANTGRSSSAIPENATVLTYTVKNGDNLGFIAEWYDVQASDLRGWNGISGNLIRAGQRLKVYIPKEKAHIYSDINKLTFTQKQGESDPVRGDNNEQIAALQQNGRNYTIYKIQNGDTLWDISRKNGISINEIKQLNNISNSKNLKPGMVIKIREKS